MHMLTLIIGDKQFSSWSMRASIILKEKKVPYQEIIAGLDWPIKFTDSGLIPINAKDDYDLPKEPASGCGCQLTQLLKIDNTQLLKGSIVEHLPRVPILIDDETNVVICDSLAISDYLEENFNEFPTLLSTDIVKRNDIRVFSNHIHADLLPLMSGMSYSNSFRGVDKQEIPEDALEQLEETLQLLKQTLERKKKKNWLGQFLFGDFSLADAMFSPIAQQIKGWNIEIQSKEVADYIDSLLNRETIKSYLNQANKPYELLKQAEKDSPAWIARHYRFWEEISMLHNSKKDVYHILDEIGVIFYTLAFEGNSKEEIVNTITKKFNIEKNVAIKDVDEFFSKLHPENNIENKLELAF
ncbi:TPA: PqqD family peptide modification chaperone [Bacillus thuringiensis]|nr:PqqD family peptide modification chaperone [Bacillus thuringiensis]